MNTLMLEELLKEIGAALEHKRISGKDFNVFSITGLDNKEVAICRLLKELLDPKGSHGNGVAFLKEFVNIVLRKDGFSDNDLKNAVVSREECIDSRRRVDLVLRIGKEVIPIEVKIFAIDQDSQLSDYYKYYQPSCNCIYYLTLDGKEPSVFSKQYLSKDQYHCISFDNDIQEWVKSCLRKDYIKLSPRVKDILTQFGEMIQNITDTKDDPVMEEILLRSEDNFISAETIVQLFNSIRNRQPSHVYDAIIKHFQNLDYSFITAKIDNYNVVASDMRYIPGLTENESKMIIGIYDDRLYYGIISSEPISSETEDFVNKCLQDTEKLKHTTHGHHWYFKYCTDPLTDYRYYCNPAKVLEENQVELDSIVEKLCKRNEE